MTTEQKLETLQSLLKSALESKDWKVCSEQEKYEFKRKFGDYDIVLGGFAIKLWNQPDK